MAKRRPADGEVNWQSPALVTSTGTGYKSPGHVSPAFNVPVQPTLSHSHFDFFPGHLPGVSQCSLVRCFPV